MRPIAPDGVACGSVFLTSGWDAASGYGATGIGDNVLLAFAVDEK